jgi:transketolase
MNQPDRTADLERMALAVRARVLDHVLRHGGGYMSQACSSAELLVTLYGALMRLGPSLGPLVPPPFSGVPGPDNPDPWNGGRYNGPRAPQLDRFFFSPVHYSLVLYSVLIEVGRLAPEALQDFNRDGSTVEMIGAEHSPGVEATAGSLPQAVSVAGGVALARKLKGEPGRTWVFSSDGELQEGQFWELLAAASWYRLDQLAIVVDCNGQQCDGAMGSVMNVEPAAERARAFGAEVCEIPGHDIPALLACEERLGRGRPLVVLARTDPCRGLEPLRDRAPRLHYLRFGSEAERTRYQDAFARMRAALGEG